MIHHSGEMKQAHECRMSKFSLCLSHTLAINAGDPGLNPNISSTYSTSAAQQKRSSISAILHLSELTHNCIVVQKHSLLMCLSSHFGK